MKPLVTYCSKKKRRDGLPIPAIDRYISSRIMQVSKQAKQDGRDMLILSGLLGLILPTTPIRFYDKLLRPKDVGRMVDLVAHQLSWFNVESVEYITEDIYSDPLIRPYHDLLAAACKRERVEMVVRPLEF